MKNVYLESFGALEISGKDYLNFLQGQLTCDVLTQSNNSVILGGYANLKGRLSALFFCYKENNKINLVMHKSLLSVIENILKKYAVFSKVNFNIDKNMNTFVEYDNDNITNFIFKSSDIEKDKNISGDSDFYKYLYVKNIPYITIETFEKYLPADISIEKTAVCFTKGCFMGQEILARMKYIGKIKKVIQKINIKNIDNIIIPSKIYNKENKSIGEIINFNNNYGLAVFANELSSDESIKINYSEEEDKYFFI